MPKYRVEALEKFFVRTIYHVEADDERQAETVSKAGEVAYDEKTIKEGDEERLETVQSKDAEKHACPASRACPNLRVLLSPEHRFDVAGADDMSVEWALRSVNVCVSVCKGNCCDKRQQ